tara:strand:+ start:41126 stop:41686 length:561 start_codon:yes stop_codon:yes gene_type:complete
MNKFLIVGLGNPGHNYVGTRHNIGFEILDQCAEHFSTSFEELKYGSLAKFKMKGRSVHLLKPSTFMNLSGKAVRYYLQSYKINLNNLLVSADDLHLPLGTIRLKRGGRDGGHNGHRDIIDKMNNCNYARLKFGIGSDFDFGEQSNFVLGTWPENQREIVNACIKKSISAIIDFCSLGIDDAMKNHN